MRRLFITFFVALLLGSIGLSQQVHVAGAVSVTYIRADGSVDPPTSLIRSQGNLYTLTGNIYFPMEIEKEGIILEGAGYTMDCSGWDFDYHGIVIFVNNVAIQNMRFRSFVSRAIDIGNSGCSVVRCHFENAGSNAEGITLNPAASYNSVSNNSFTGVYHSIVVYGSYNDIYRNNITESDVGISLNDGAHHNNVIENRLMKTGLHIYEPGPQNIVIGNTVNNKPLLYIEGLANQVVGDAGQVVMVNCNNITVTGLDLPFAFSAMLLYGTDNCLIVNNNITSNVQGIELFKSSNNRIVGNRIMKNRWGILLYKASNNSIIGNNLTDNSEGLYCSSMFSECSGNSVYNNSFVNSRAAMPFFQSADWDAGYPSGGNYWSDYTGFDLYSGPYQNETGSDGIGDTCYKINEYNIDRYPHMGPLNVPLGPTAAFKFAPLLVGLEVNFNASGSRPGWNGTRCSPILNYQWDFGDGSNITTTSTLTYHEYSSSGTYKVTLNVTDSRGWWVTSWTAVGLYRHAVAIENESFNVYVITNAIETEFSFNWSHIQINLGVSGLEGINGYCNLTIPKTLMKGNPWTATLNGGLPLYAPTISDNGTHTSIYLPLITGWSASRPDSMHIIIQGTDVIKLTTYITCTLDPVSIALGKQVTISGAITPTRTSANITISIVGPNGFVTTIDALTQSTGSYSATFSPDRTGTWTFRASWQGDNQHLGSQSIVASLIVVPLSSGPAFPQVWLAYVAVASAVSAILVIVLLRMRRKRARARSKMVFIPLLVFIPIPDFHVKSKPLRLTRTWETELKPFLAIFGTGMRALKSISG
jgi:parallel beta-helix repeat protein